MIPLLLLVLAGYLGVSRVAAAEPDEAAQPATPVPWREWIKLRRLAGQLAAMRATGILAAWAVLLVLMGAGPMALSGVSRSADPITAQAIAGSTAPLALPAAVPVRQVSCRISLTVRAPIAEKSGLDTA